MTDTLQETLERYLRLCSQRLRPASVRLKRLNLRNAIQFLRVHYPDVRSWAHVQRVPHIEAWLNAVYLSPLATSTRIVRIGDLYRFFNDMLDWQWPESPPPGLIRPEDMPRLEHPLPKPLPHDLDQAVQDVLREKPSIRTMGLLLLRLTGMRIGEMVDLDVNALDKRDPDNHTLHVPMGKTRAERVIPLHAEAVDLIHAIQAQRGRKLGSMPMPESAARYLMVGPRGKHPGVDAYRATLKNLTAHLSTTEHIHPHRFRHTFATEMIRAGMTVQVLMKILGHSHASMTLRYVEVATTDLRRDYDKAIAQLSVLNNLPLPEPVFRHAEPTHLRDIMDILVQIIDALRRDNANTIMDAPLARFVKRLRRTRKDLNRFLEKL